MKFWVNVCQENLGNLKRNFWYIKIVWEINAIYEITGHRTLIGVEIGPVVYRPGTKLARRYVMTGYRYKNKQR